MKANSAAYEPFLEGFSNTDEFVKARVEPMWVAAEQLQIMALGRILQTTVSVVYIDQGERRTPRENRPPVLALCSWRKILRWKRRFAERDTLKARSGGTCALREVRLSRRPAAASLVALRARPLRRPLPS